MAGLRQKGNYSNFTDFLTEFSNNADILGWDKTSCVRELRDKVNQDLSNAMAVQINLPNNDDWKGWVRMTQQLVINLERQKYRAKLASSNTSDNHGNGNNKNNNSNQTGDPMDLDKLHLNKLSPAKRDRY
jgi:hypothetical protein